MSCACFFTPCHVDCIVKLGFKLFCCDHLFHFSRNSDTRVGGPAERYRLGDLPLGDLPLGDLPFGDLPFGDLPFGDLPLGDLPSGDLPFGDHWRLDCRFRDRFARDICLTSVFGKKNAAESKAQRNVSRVKSSHTRGIRNAIRGWDASRKSVR